jgi:PAS domain S-box-containing protein
MSVILANSMIVAGIILQLIGLELFINKRGPRIQNYLLLILFTCIHYYFIFVYPSLAVRDLNSSVALFFVCFQCCFLLFYRVNSEQRSLTLWVGIVFAGYCVLNLIRISEYFLLSHETNDFFGTGASQAPIFTSFLILFILLTYSLAMMVNKCLLKDIGVQEEKFAKAFHSAPYAITLTRLSDGTMLDINETFTEIMGYTRDDVLGRKTMELNLWQNNDDRDAMFNALNSNGKIHEMDLHVIKKNGESVTGLLSAEIIKINGEECILASIGDITERKKAENRVKDLLAEKEIILKEVHHRIKNNMNTINSLLNIQAETIKEPAAAAALEDAGNRVQSMMVLYDQLYQSANINDVSLKDYLPALVNQIVRNFPNSQSVKVENYIDDFILDVKSVSSIGILINELLTNIMKHAFTGRADGLITVSASLDKEVVTIIVQDNGVGLPESIDFENPTGFGFSLIDMLTEQLKGTMQIERLNGARFILKFHK